MLLTVTPFCFMGEAVILLHPFCFGDIMPLKDPVARREYKRQYHLKNKEKRNKAALENYYANRERRQTMMHENRKKWKAEGVASHAESQCLMELS